MRLETITSTFTVCSFEELTPSAQEHAIETNRYFNVDHDWWEWTYEDASSIGLQITSFDLGRGQSIDGEFTLNCKEVADKIIAEHGDQCATYKTAKHYLKVYNPLVMKELIETGEPYPNTEDIDADFLRLLLENYWTILDNEYDYLTSDECIRESLIANEYEFRQDGTIY